MHCDPLYTTIEASTKLVISAVFWCFVGYNPRFVVPGVFSMHGDPPLHDYRGIDKTHNFSPFLPFSWVITHDLWSRQDFDAL